MSGTYAINELQELPDADLNALAARLRGATCHLCEIGHRLSNDGQLHLPSQSIGMIEVQPCKMAQFKPATSRDQSGELLEWLLDKHSFAGCLNYTSPPSIEIWTSGWATAVSVTIPGNTARSETIAFCAAMLAMEGRLK